MLFEVKYLANSAEKLIESDLISRFLLSKIVKRTLAFSLAEVLFTLIVIGIVASITIPALIQNTKDAELKTTWKSTFADLNQALSRVKQENGGSYVGLCAYLYDSNCFRDKLLPYLHYSQTCGRGGVFGKCSSQTNKHLNGNLFTQNIGWNDYMSGIILTNGVHITLIYDYTECFHPLDDPIWPVCGEINADINGIYKGPNTWGRDIFGGYLLKDRFVPYGSINDPDYSGSNPSINCVEGSVATNNKGFGCSAKYLTQ